MAYIYIYTHLYVNSIHTWGLCIEALLAVLFSAQKVLVDGVQRPLGDVLEVRCDFSKASCGWGLMWKKQGAGSGADPWVGGSPQRAPVGDFHAGQGNSSDNKRTHVYIYICIYIYTNSYVREWMVLLFFFFLFFIFASRKRGSTQTIHILFTLQWWSFSFLSWSLLPLPSLLVRVFQK